MRPTVASHSYFASSSSGLFPYKSDTGIVEGMRANRFQIFGAERTLECGRLASAFPQAACCRFPAESSQRSKSSPIPPQGKPRSRKRRQAIRTPKNPAPGAPQKAVFCHRKPAINRSNFMTAEKLDKIFDDGEEEFLPYLNPAKAVRPGHLAQRVNVDFPSWMICSLDFEADRPGVPRQSLIKVWIAERLAQERRHKAETLVHQKP